MMESSPNRPRLRADLIISEQQRQPEGLFFVFKDLRTGRFLRFGEAEHFIARQLDGQTPLAAVRERAKAKFSSELTAEALDQFVLTLRRVGLLESEAERPAAAGSQGTSAKPRSVRGSVLYLRFPAFDPDRLLARLVSRLCFFFTPHFLLASALVVVVGVAVAFLNGEDIQRDLRGLWRFDAFLLAWITILLVAAVHEFGHGLTCKRFGGAVHEMGFMLIYFQPAFYCNVSDAWLFPEKSKRLWVTFAGAYIEILIWSLATLVWRLVEPDTWISFFAMVVMATSGIKTLVNLNPLIKLDGYYLLSDALGIPNLRQRSTSYLGARLNGFLRLGPAAASAVSRRERAIYVTYGLLAGAYSFWLLGYVALRFGAFLTERYHGWGFILFGGFLMALLGNRVKHLWAKTRWALQASRARAGSMRARVAAAAAALAAVLVLGRMHATVGGSFHALPLHNADVETEVDGIVAEVLVGEGGRIAKGAVIARLSNPDLTAQLEKTEAEIQEKNANLKRLTSGPREEEVKAARRGLGIARSRLDEARKLYKSAQRMRAEKLARARSASEKSRARVEYAQKELERLETLLAEGLISRQSLEAAEEQVAVRRKELEEAEASLRELRSDELSEFQKDLAIATKEAEDAQSRLELLLAARPEEVEAARAVLAGLEAQRRYLQEQIGLLTVLSPSAGIVTTPNLKLQELQGQFVKKGDLIAEVHELQSITAEIAVAESDIGEVRPGQRVVVRARAHPGLSFEGRVVAIAVAAARPDPATASVYASEHNKTFLVTSELENRSLLLKPGMTGYAKIYGDRRSVFDVVTRHLAGYLRVEFWSWW